MREPSADCGLRRAKLTDWGDRTVNRTLGRAELPPEPWVGRIPCFVSPFCFQSGGAFRKEQRGKGSSARVNFVPQALGQKRKAKSQNFGRALFRHTAEPSYLYNVEERVMWSRTKRTVRSP